MARSGDCRSIDGRHHDAGRSVFFPEVTAEAVDRSGLAHYFPVIDVETAWARDAESCINRGLALRDQYDHVALTSASDTLYLYGGEGTAMAMLAEELDAHTDPPAETRDEVLSLSGQVRSRSSTGRTTGAAHPACT